MILRAYAAAAALLFLPQAPQNRYRSGVDVVEVGVSVMRGGVPVAGLTSANFLLTDNGVPQDVTSVRLESLPLNVLLVLDTSSSVAGDKLAHLIDASHKLIQNLRPEDRVALVTFSQQVRLLVPLTGDMSRANDTIDKIVPQGATSMFDALHVALLLSPIEASRSLVILFSDGLDNSSWIPGPALVDEARQLGVVIHAVALRQQASHPMFVAPAPEDARRDLLRSVADASGGRVWSATSSRDLRTLFTRALEEMRARYLLTFTPAGVRHEGWHELKVTLKNARGEVTARPAYFVAQKNP